MQVTFLLNGEHVTANAPPTTTLLDWLRENQGLSGTKEGCNEGDCGACTVMVTDGAGSRALNACILFLPQLTGKAVRTVEGISGPNEEIHPVQKALVDHHGSQCGYCTPGFVVSMAVSHLNGSENHADQLAGNLCRCTGYAPILKAASAASQSSVPAWMYKDAELIANQAGAGASARDKPPTSLPASGVTPSRASARSLPEGASPDAGEEVYPAMPGSADELAHWFAENPHGTLIAGATDVGLWITKHHRNLGPIAFLNQCSELGQITVQDSRIEVGATVTVADFGQMIADHHPAFAELIRRYGSAQVRNAATIGGNVAGGSPIGDSMPALIALGASVRLRHRDKLRTLPLEDLYIDYRKQDRRPGEFIAAILIPRQPDRLRVYKLSKRFDQDISAVCGAFSITVTDGTVTSARIAFGGMAGIPKRAKAVETAITHKPWTEATVRTAQVAFEEDFTPLSDMRASAQYRLASAKNMLLRAYWEDQGQSCSVLQITP
ncbi:MAG: xanthine dehydrogenase small subunit [Pseudomonadota bacterium]